VPGILFDTHAFYWFVSGDQRLSDFAISAIGEHQLAGTLYVSPITAWELALATRKTNNAPQLGDRSVGTWFRKAMRSTAAKLAPISQRIAIEAAEVVAATGHRDPGDCYLIATARVRKIQIVTRDSVVLGMAARHYLGAIEC
jgi:PIN domain nuclease of toxin-antitoxin system